VAWLALKAWLPLLQVTCILKADLGCSLSEASLVHGLAAGLGLVDAFLDRMLTGVILLRDEVEQQRFKVGLGLGDALLDRMLTGNILLRDEVEQQRFAGGSQGPSLHRVRVFWEGGRRGSGYVVWRTSDRTSRRAASVSRAGLAAT
jgi:hypothetical protein